MFRNLVEHMVVETDPGGDAHRSLAVEIDLDGDGGLACLADMARHPLLAWGGELFTTKKGKKPLHLVFSTNGHANRSVKARLVRLVAQDIALRARLVTQRGSILDNHQQIIGICWQHRFDRRCGQRRRRERIAPCNDLLAPGSKFRLIGR